MNKKISDILKGTEFEDMIEVFESANYKTIGDVFNKIKIEGNVLGLFNSFLDDFIDDKKQKVKLIGILQREVDLIRNKNKNGVIVLVVIILGPILLMMVKCTFS